MGAAPIQNIGAYGVELKDVFVKLEAIELVNGKKKIFTKEDCHFGYRESVFKRKLKGAYCITKVYLQLTRKEHSFHIDYGAIPKYVAYLTYSWHFQIRLQSQYLNCVPKPGASLISSFLKNIRPRESE